MSNAYITARVAFLRELAGEKLVELSVENTVGNKLALLANLAGHFVGDFRANEGRKVTEGSQPIEAQSMRDGKLESSRAIHRYRASKNRPDRVQQHQMDGIWYE
jgi:hypothetical protein